MKTVNTVVVGGGHAGLAMSYCLTQEGVEHLVLERGDVGQRWRDERWDSLTLLTPNWATQPPGFPYDDDAPDGFVSRDEYVDYLERYARSFGAPVQPNTNVTRVSAAVSGGFTIETSQGSLRARQVVAATGPFHVPVIPEASRAVPSQVVQIHSSEYRNPSQLPPGAVLVVGSGNSGLQIVDELSAAGRRVFASLGGLRSMPRRYRGRDAVRWLLDFGALDTLTADASAEMNRTPPPSLSGVGGGHDLNLRVMSERGAVFVGRLLECCDGCVHFSDDLAATLAASADAYRRFRARVDQFLVSEGVDAPLDPTPCADGDLLPPPSSPIPELSLEDSGIRSVIWATGFRLSYSWLDVPVFDDAGRPLHQQGVSTHPGLYFLGLRWLSKYKSFFIYGVGEDARRLAAHIASRPA